MSKNITIKLNGKDFKTTSDKTILDVARENNIEIPTLCQDEYLKPFGSCWVCLVEVKGEGFVPSCATQVNDEMEIETNNNDVLATRKIALELLLSDHYANCNAPCSNKCPANVDIQGYIALINNGLYHEAVKLIKERLPLPISVGKICPATCEDECRRQLVDESVAIRQIKCFAGVKDLKDEANTYMPEIKPSTGKEVAIVGAGPAGLTAAFYLTRKGHKCIIFEAMPKNGGMMRYGIPEYRLPKKILDQEINLIEKMGVKINNNLELGKDFTLQFLYKRYDAIFLGMGAWKAVSLRLKGEKLKNCHLGTDFLRKVIEGEITKLQGTVAIIGGGNTAIDSARTSLRLGAKKVMIVYRRAEEQMPAEDNEIKDAKEEGIEFHLLQNPTKIIGKNGKVAGMQCVKMRLGEPDSSGRKRPIPMENSDFILACNYVIPAISQKPNIDYLNDDYSTINSDKLHLTKWNTIEINEETKQTNIDKIFSGGDVVRGPATVIEAVADAFKAAHSMNQFLQGEKITLFKDKFDSQKAETVKDLDPEEFVNYEKAERIKPTMSAVKDRIKNFKEVEHIFKKKEVNKETARCIECGCNLNQTCKLREYATDYNVIVSTFMGEVNKHPIDDSHPFILREPNKCIKCGRCVRTCLEIQGVGALGYIYRGFNTLVAPEFGESLLKTACESCGKCIDVCPVGALTQRNTALKTAPIAYKKTNTTCALCGCGCRVNYFSINNKIMKAEAADNKITGNNICFNAHFGFEVLQSKTRLTKPMIRIDNKLKQVSWDKAFEFFRENISKFDTHSALFSHGNFTNEESYFINKIAEKFSISHKYSWSLNDSAIKQNLGINYSPNPHTDLHKTELIVLVGDIPHTLGIKVVEAVKEGKKLLVINREENKFSRLADFFIQSDNYIEILNEFAKIFVEYRHHNVDYIINFVENFVAYNHKLQRVEHTDEFEKYVKLICNSRVLFVYSESNLDFNSQNAILNLSILKGNIGEQGTGIISISEMSNKYTLLENGFKSPQKLTTIKSALLFGEDPLCKNQMLKYEWLNKLDFLVVAECYLTETAKMANLVLPLATFLETDGSIFNNNTIQKIQKAIEPLPGKSNLQVLSQILGKKVSLENDREEIEDGFREKNLEYQLNTLSTPRGKTRFMIDKDSNKKIEMAYHEKQSLQIAKIEYNTQRQMIKKFKDEKLK